MERDFDNIFTEEFAEGASRAFWVTSWADGEEERGTLPGGSDLMDIAPDTPLSAWVAAGQLIGMLEATNKASIHVLADRAARADDAAGDIGDIDAEDFGHYMAMEAMGQGVSWFDDHEKFNVKIPNMEYHAESQFTPNPTGYAPSPTKRTRKVLGAVGDVDPILHGGGIVYLSESGPVLAYTPGLDDEDDDTDPRAEMVLYEVAVEDDVTKDLNWVSWGDVARSGGESAAELKKQARSKDVMTRAFVYMDVAGHDGWENLDGYPRKLTVREMNKWWFPRGKLAKKV